MAEILARADADDVEAYLEAAPDGNALYRRWGFDTRRRGAGFVGGWGEIL
jgi:hypothetical protein